MSRQYSNNSNSKQPGRRQQYDSNEEDYDDDEDQYEQEGLEDQAQEEREEKEEQEEREEQEEQEEREEQKEQEEQEEGQREGHVQNAIIVEADLDNPLHRALLQNSYGVPFSIRHSAAANNKSPNAIANMIKPGPGASKLAGLMEQVIKQKKWTKQKDALFDAALSSPYQSVIEV